VRTRGGTCWAGGRLRGGKEKKASTKKGPENGAMPRSCGREESAQGKNYSEEGKRKEEREMQQKEAGGGKNPVTTRSLQQGVFEKGGKRPLKSGKKRRNGGKGGKGRVQFWHDRETVGGNGIKECRRGKSGCGVKVFIRRKNGELESTCREGNPYVEKKPLGPKGGGGGGFPQKNKRKKQGRLIPGETEKLATVLSRNGRSSSTEEQR